MQPDIIRFLADIGLISGTILNWDSPNCDYTVSHLDGLNYISEAVVIFCATELNTCTKASYLWSLWSSLPVLCTHGCDQWLMSPVHGSCTSLLGCFDCSHPALTLVSLWLVLEPLSHRAAPHLFTSGSTLLAHVSPATVTPVNYDRIVKRKQRVRTAVIPAKAPNSAALHIY